MKKRFLCFLLVLALTAPAALAAKQSDAAGGPAWSNVCRSFVLDGGYRRAEQTWSDRKPAFALHDLDGDGVPELLARNNAEDAENLTAYVYTVVYSSLQYAGDAGFFGPADHFLPGSGLPGLYCLNGPADRLEGIYYTLEGGKVVSETVLTVTPDPDRAGSSIATRMTGDEVLFDSFAPRDAAGMRTAAGSALTYRTVEEIRAMGWDKFVSDSLRADNTLFRDVSLSHWAWSYADYVCRTGLMTGTGGGAFTPSGVISRGQVVTILYRLEGEPKVSDRGVFSDVPENAWYAVPARWAVGIGLTEAADGAFLPDQTVERQDLARMLYLYARYKKLNTPTAVADFSDWDQVRDDCVEPMYWAVGTGLMNGTGGGRLDPTGSLTRAQLAAMVQRFCENILK